MDLFTFSPIKKIIRTGFLLPLALLGWYSCMDYGPSDEEDFDPDKTVDGVFITNEGSFMYGNASLSYYIPSEKRVENEVFIRANTINLGDVAQSMVVRNGLGYIVVNNSGIIFVIDVKTFKVRGTIGPFTSPRHIHFLSDTKAYVTQLWDDRIAIVNPSTLEITGYIKTDMQPGGESTEQMVQYGRYVFTNCSSYNKRILVIDSETDSVADEIEVGIQPVGLVLDKFGKLWTITNGGYKGSPYGYEAPVLCRIDPESRRIEKTFTFDLDDSPAGLCLNRTRDTLYFINKAVWRMDVKDERVPVRPFLPDQESLFYAIAVDPTTSEVYVADAIDYVQPGVVYRYTPDGELVDRFRTGITPGSFCFNPDND